jgi:hypothetical protein
MLKPSPRPAKVSDSAAGTAVPTAELDAKIRNLVHLDDILTGNIRRRPGQVFVYQGCEYMVKTVNQCRAVAQRLTKTIVTIKGRQFEAADAVINVSTTCHPTEIIRVETVKPRLIPPAPTPAVAVSSVTLTPRRRQNAASGKPEGKLALVKRLLLSGTMTKSQVVREVLGAFPATPEKTARNTVNWCVTDLERTDGKKSNHLKE